MHRVPENMVQFVPMILESQADGKNFSNDLSTQLSDYGILKTFRRYLPECSSSTLFSKARDESMEMMRFFSKHN